MPPLQVHVVARQSIHSTNTLLVSVRRLYGREKRPKIWESGGLQLVVLSVILRHSVHFFRFFSEFKYYNFQHAVPSIPLQQIFYKYPMQQST